MRQTGQLTEIVEGRGFSLLPRENLMQKEYSGKFSTHSSTSELIYCAVCGEWSARETPLGLRCHLCECRDLADLHPVSLCHIAFLNSLVGNIGVQSENMGLNVKELRRRIEEYFKTVTKDQLLKDLVESGLETIQKAYPNS